MIGLDMKKLLTVVSVLILLCTLLASCSDSNKLKITASDIEKAELIVMPSAENERYKLVDESDYDNIVELIAEIPNKSVANPEGISGGAATLYITLTDGTVHTLCNDGNVYIVLDDTSYEMKIDFLSLWNEYGFNIGNTEVPSDFSY